jgi:L-lactate utilization protein LutC
MPATVAHAADIQAMIEQFSAAASAVVATVDITDRTAPALNQAIWRAAGNANRVLFAPPHDVPRELFTEFANDPRVLSNACAEDWVNSPVGVTEGFADVARTGSVCVDVGYQRTGMASLLAPLHIAVQVAETIVPQLRDISRREIAIWQAAFLPCVLPTADL